MNSSQSVQEKTLQERLDIDFALEAARLGIWEVDPVTNVVHWNARCREFFGLQDDHSMPYQQVLGFIHPEDRDRVDEAFRAAMNPQVRRDCDVRYRTVGAGDGVLRWVRFTGRSYFDESGALIRFAGIAQEVTQDIQALENATNAARFRSLIEQAPVATCLFLGRELRIEVANELMLDHWGKGRTVLGLPLREALPEWAGESFLRTLDDLFSSGRTYEARGVPVERNGSDALGMCYFDFTCKPLLDAAGDVYAIMETAVDVTERFIASKKLQDSEVYFRNLTDTVPAIIWMTDPDGQCTYLNKQWYDQTGQTPEEAEGFGWLDATHPDDAAEAGRLFLEANEKQTPFSVLYRLRHHDGRYRWSIDTARPRFNPDGTYEGMIGTVLDVHDQRTAEEELTRFKYMADHANDPFILMREDGTFAYLNTLALERWGYTAEEATRLRVPDVDPIYNDAVFQAVFARSKTEKLPPFETLHQRKDGTIYSVEVNMGGLTIGRQPYLFAIARDLTDRKKAESALQESESRFRNLVREATVGIIVLQGEDLVVEIVNEAYGKLIGRSVDELMRKPIFEIIPEAEADFRSLIEGVRETGESLYLYDTPYFVWVNGVKKEGYLNLVYQPYKEKEGRITGVMVLCQDVTKQVLITKQIEASEARLRSVLAVAPAAIGLFVGRDLVVEMPNRSFIDIVGKGPDIVGRPLREVMPELENQPYLQILDDVYTSGVGFRSFGSQVDIVQGGVMTHNFYNITYTPLLNSEGQVYAILDIAVDVTEEIRARQALEESEERYRTLSAELDQLVQQRTQELEDTVQDLKRSNESLQQFAYVASHDLQEPLRKIQSFGNLLRKYHADQLGEGADHLQRMQNAANRMSRLIHDLLAYSRISARQEVSARVPLNEVVQVTINDLELLIEETGAVVEVGALPTVLGDHSQLGQLFQNLLSNALKFRRPGVPPHIRISARLVPAAEVPPTVRPSRVAARYHCIDVTDNGIGFEEQYIDRVFQVFQRLHGRNEYSGTGIGLAICQQVAANHGGGITATSAPDEGSTFSIYVPLSSR